MAAKRRILTAPVKGNISPEVQEPDMEDAQKSDTPTPSPEDEADE